MKPWYEKLFENYGNKYEEEVFVRGTAGECDFIEQEAGFDQNKKILDIGCGTGRHSVELARRGYHVMGVDLSESMLTKAREKAAASNVIIEFQQQDARHLPFHQAFDMAIMICEGAFPLMETDEMNFQILESAARALKEDGKLIFTTLNGLFLLFHSVKEFIEQQQGNTEETDGSTRRSSEAGSADLSFDLMTFRDNNRIVMQDDDGNDMELDCSERFYVPSEITWLLKSLGFKKIDIYGAKLGAFSRNDRLTTEDFEMLVVAEGMEHRA
jgi:SAM-dependent methyltransferase